MKLPTMRVIKATSSTVPTTPTIAQVARTPRDKFPFAGIVLDVPVYGIFICYSLCIDTFYTCE